MAAVKRRDHREDDPNDGDNAGLGRRKPASQDATHQNDRDHQWQRRVLGSGCNGKKGCARPARP